MAEYIVQINDDCWLAPWDGDPGRTMVKTSAKRFKSKRSAQKAISSARELRPNSTFALVATTPAPAPAAGSERSE